jgi:hypothetical protein
VRYTPNILGVQERWAKPAGQAKPGKNREIRENRENREIKPARLNMLLRASEQTGGAGNETD